MPRRALDVKGRNSREAKEGIVKAIAAIAMAIAMAARTVWMVGRVVVRSGAGMVMNCLSV